MEMTHYHKQLQTLHCLDAAGRRNRILHVKRSQRAGQSVSSLTCENTTEPTETKLHDAQESIHNFYINKTPIIQSFFSLTTSSTTLTAAMPTCFEENFI